MYTYTIKLTIETKDSLSDSMDDLLRKISQAAYLAANSASNPEVKVELTHIDKS